MLLINAKLSKGQIKDFEQLLKEAKAVDKGAPAIYPHLLSSKRQIEGNFLYYQGKKLVAFLGLYFFYAKMCEVTLLVAPKRRNQGLARVLLQASLPLLHKHEMQSLLFSAPTSFSYHKEDSLLSYKHSEYQMLRRGSDLCPLSEPCLSLRQANIADIPFLVTLDKLSFHTQHLNMEQRFQRLLEDKRYTVFIALNQGVPIGKAHIHWQKTTTVLSDIAIVPEFQGQGLGSKLIAQCINLAINQGKARLSLDVEAHNQQALKIYLKNGFSILKQTDFWTMDLQDLVTWCENSIMPQ